jgi:hypothetical protein
MIAATSANLVGWLNQHSGFDAYEDWCALGMAFKIECGDDAKELWALSHNDTVTDDVIESKWESFASEAASEFGHAQQFYEACASNSGGPGQFARLSLRCSVALRSSRKLLSLAQASHRHNRQMIAVAGRRAAADDRRR